MEMRNGDTGENYTPDGKPYSNDNILTLTRNGVVKDVCLFYDESTTYV